MRLFVAHSFGVLDFELRPDTSCSHHLDFPIQVAERYVIYSYHVKYTMLLRSSLPLH